MPLSWSCKSFEQLAVAELYACLRLRAEVFVIEQQCLFPDLDGLDQQALHLMAWDGRVVGQMQLAAYARLLPPGLKATAPVISRVVNAPKFRGQGIGHELNRQALQHCERLWPGQGITLFAQAHLQHFYARAGFAPVGEPFDEDGILHQEMRIHPKES
jgi:ElaA protein